MKRIFALLLCVCLVCSFAVTANASESSVLIYSETTVLDDGMIVLDEIFESAGNNRSSDIVRTRRRTYSDNGTTVAVIAITATFRYDGNTVSVVSKSVSQCDTYEGWSYKQTSFTSSGGTVTLNAKLTKLLIFNKPIQMTLSCDKNGNITFT